MSIQAVAAVLAAVVFPAGMIYAALIDLATLTIRNSLVIALAVSYFILAPLAGLDLRLIGGSTLVSVFVFAVTFVLFAMGWIGGGDAKLAAASVLWFSPQEALVYLIYASALGGILTLMLLSFRRIALPASMFRFSWVNTLRDPRAGVPYGAAMAPAALLVFPQTVWFTALV